MYNHDNASVGMRCLEWAHGLNQLVTVE